MRLNYRVLTLALLGTPIGAAVQQAQRCRTPYVARELTMRDLLVHRIGLGEGVEPRLIGGS